VIGKIRSRKLETWAALEADGQLDWQKLFASQPSKPAKAKAEPASTPAAADSPKPAPAPPSKPWQVLLNDVQLRDYQVHLADRKAQPAVALELGPLNLDLQKFDSLNGSPLRSSSTRRRQTRQAQADGEVNLARSAPAQCPDQGHRPAGRPVLHHAFIRLELRSGMLGSDLAVNLKSTEPLASASPAAPRLISCIRSTP
jgi:hypothetical protein